jgi:hypothetical protein
MAYNMIADFHTPIHSTSRCSVTVLNNGYSSAEFSLGIGC